MSVPHSGTRHAAISTSASLIVADVLIKVFKNGSTVADTDLSQLAQGSFRISADIPTVGFYQYSVAGLGIGAHLREEIRSNTSAWPAQVQTTTVGPAITASREVIVVDGKNGSCGCNGTTARLVG